MVSMTSTESGERISSDRIQDALYAFTQSQMVYTAIDLGIFTAISKGQNTVLALQTTLNCSARGLSILLDGLVGIGFLLKDTSGYQLPVDIRHFLVQDNPNYIGGLVQHCKALYENWTHLTECVRSGHPSGGAQSLADTEAYFAELVKGLYVSNYPTAQKLAQQLQGEGLSVLDVAGGSAVWSIALLEADLNRQATLLDYSSVIEVGKGYIQQHGLQDRYTYLAGDLLEINFDQPAPNGSGFDLVTVGHICHAIGPEATQKMLCGLAKWVKPGGKIVIIDFVPNVDRSGPTWPLVFGVNMLISTDEGNVYTEAEFQNWLSVAGFHETRTVEIESAVTALIATKAL